ncbi:MAG: hypothetical protein CFH06_01591 [Alphaproteobacteria bacterium MarineAlpha3_Bin5]|nr:oxidoreductase [Magnetovibrio sp.]PPR76869.1 MAG: hypothetical protein CFH06_01591 [Alphaproteobacteria bacterium MarineAlpha3_Bin5]
MKALIIGYGSIGKRHTDLLNKLGAKVAVVSRRNLSIPAHYSNVEAAVKEHEPGYVIIASRTSEHRDDIHALAAAGFTGKLLIEKPVYQAGCEQPPHVFSKIKVAFNLRFHPALIHFRQIISERKIYAVSAYVGSYLPNWRPDTDYRTGYSAITSQGGGVLRDLSHELDYLIWLFGPWVNLTASGGHFSNLEIDSDDVFTVLFETKQVPSISLQMNYLDTKARRKVIALTDKGSLSLDLISGSVEAENMNKTFVIGRDDTYIAQHKAMLFDDDSIICDIKAGLEVMGMIDAAAHASKYKKWIQP